MKRSSPYGTCSRGSQHLALPFASLFPTSVPLISFSSTTTTTTPSLTA